METMPSVIRSWNISFIMVWKVAGDNPNTTQTPECTKDKYNAKIKSERVSPKVSPTTYIG
jgi:hypothetical protein